MARVLVVEPIHRVFDEILTNNGIDVVRAINIGREDLIKAVSNFDALVVRSRTIVDREILEAGARGRLRVVARAGVGLDNIDVEYARRLGIEVVNVPTASTQSVAELTIGLIIAAARMIPQLCNKVKMGRWERRLGIELANKTLLIIGFGRIGRRVAEIAKAIGMRVLAYDIVDIREEALKRGVEVVDDLCKGLKEADVVSLHVPLTPQTRYMINREIFEKCFKKGAILVNTSRGAVIKTEDLLWALDNGILSAVAIDVLEHEPPATEIELRLVRHPRVVVTPHIGAQTVEAQERIARELAYILLNLLSGKALSTELRYKTSQPNALSST